MFYVRNFKTHDKDSAYFVTFTIVEWLKVLQDDSFKMIVIDAIRYYQNKRGLVIYAYCIMPNHVHMIIQSNGTETVSEVLRDLKKFTSKEIVKKLEMEGSNEAKEVLMVFKKAGEKLNRIKNYKVWQDGNHAVVLFSNNFIWQKLNYIHNNPVEYGIAANIFDYEFSSARNYTNKKGLLDVVLLQRQVTNYK